MTRRRRIALALQSWLYKVAFWLDVHTAPKYDKDKWPIMEMSDKEWEAFADMFESECE
jgi:hypothetical protein